MELGLLMIFFHTMLRNSKNVAPAAVFGVAC